MVRYLCEITTHKGRASTHLHHLVLLNKEKQEPKKFATKKQFNFNSCGMVLYIIYVRA